MDSLRGNPAISSHASSVANAGNGGVSRSEKDIPRQQSADRVTLDKTHKNSGKLSTLKKVSQAIVGGIRGLVTTPARKALNAAGVKDKQTSVSGRIARMSILAAGPFALATGFLSGMPFLGALGALVAPGIVGSAYRGGRGFSEGVSKAIKTSKKAGKKVRKKTRKFNHPLAKKAAKTATALTMGAAGLFGIAASAPSGFVREGFTFAGRMFANKTGELQKPEATGSLRRKAVVSRALEKGRKFIAISLPAAIFILPIFWYWEQPSGWGQRPRRGRDWQEQSKARQKATPGAPEAESIYNSYKIVKNLPTGGFFD